MQERTYDNEDTLTDNANSEDLMKALQKNENKFVSLHKVDSIVKNKKGNFKVNTKGKWQRTRIKK